MGFDYHMFVLVPSGFYLCTFFFSQTTSCNGNPKVAVMLQGKREQTHWYFAGEGDSETPENSVASHSFASSFA